MLIINVWLAFALATFVITLWKTWEIKNKPRNYSFSLFKYCMMKWWKLLPNFIDNFEDFRAELQYRFNKCLT